MEDKATISIKPDGMVIYNHKRPIEITINTERDDIENISIDIYFRRAEDGRPD